LKEKERNEAGRGKREKLDGRGGVPMWLGLSLMLKYIFFYPLLFVKYNCFCPILLFLLHIWLKLAVRTTGPSFHYQKWCKNNNAPFFLLFWHNSWQWRRWRRWVWWWPNN
jgi:hypothetical protein